ncbi:phosphate acyltransferase PlsX [Candidatus Pelagibacter sp.]|nr:phosphate acyltransferase PlsX [Candidatus Pelagibacter sp.]
MSKVITIAVDAMGGDNSPKKIIDGINFHYQKNSDFFYKIFGNSDVIKKIIPDSLYNNAYEIIDTKEQVKGTDSPLSAAKKGKATSMWMAIDSVKKKESDIIISAGNTGALFVIAKLNLEMLENIDKPALSGLWPNKNGINVVLDLGASIDCSEKNLIDFSLMGSALFKALFPDENPKVALLNIGSEELKGNETIKNTYKKMNSQKNQMYDFEGYIEGNEIMDGKVNVIVTDGFTGNVALKTAEGTANFITDELKKTLTGSILGKISSLLNLKNINKFKKKLDPRLYNGAILLGLDTPVVKSHGSTDYIGFANSLDMCGKIVSGNLIDKIKQSID